MPQASVEAARRARVPGLVAAILAATGLVGGCATTAEQNNPADGGFFRAVQGVSGGQYEQRLQQREETLDESEQVGQRLSERYRQLQQEQAELDREIDALQGRLGELDAQLLQARRQLDTVQSGNVDLRRSLDNATARLERARRELRASEGLGAHSVQRLASEIGEIEVLVTQLTANL